LSVWPQAFLILLDVVGTILDIVALILLFQRDSSDWFKAIKNPRSAMAGINVPTKVLWESPGDWRPDGAEYKIKYSGQFLGIPKYGFIGKGTVGAGSGMVRLAGQRIQAHLLAVLFLPGVSALDEIVGIWFGAKLKLVPLLIICAAILLIVYYRWKPWFNVSVFVEKQFITNLGRSGKNVVFCLPDPSGTGGPPVKVSVKAKSEDEAMKIVEDLRSSGPILPRPIHP